MDGKNKVPFGIMFSVAFVLFGSHAGGGFASGNMAFQNYIISGAWAPWSAILTMLILTVTIKEAMVMYNTRKLGSYKELFENLYHPYDRLSVIFDIFFYIMIFMTVGVAIATAASTLETTFGLNYYAGILIVGAVILMLTIFGADLVRKASTVAGTFILICAISIFCIGIFYEAPELNTARIGDVLTDFDISLLPNAILRAFTYAGFQLVIIPTMLVCGAPLVTKKSCTVSMGISFILNSAALVLSVVMLMKWQGVYTGIDGGTTIPTLTIIHAMGNGFLKAVYTFALLLCLIISSSTAIFGFVERFEKVKVLSKVKSVTIRSAITSAFVMVLSMAIATFGLTDIIKYGYGYCGYFAIAAFILPLMIIGHIKNKRYIRNHPECEK